MNLSRSAPLFVCLFALSCTPAPAPRSTLQADGLAKSDLSGVWYFRQTVIGVPYTTGFTFIGEQGYGEMEKVVWNIQEDVLTAHRAYEYVRGTEQGQPSQKNGPDGGYLGAPVASFRIKSHFDIIREYNAATGEEYDKLIESTERKWYERKFLRVDWSENLVTNFNFLADPNSWSVANIKQDPVKYYVSDPKDPDAFRLERPDSKSNATYLEVTQKLVASPESITWDDGSTAPLCYFEYQTEDCSSQEIKVRNSFRRVDERDYEPWAYSDTDMDRFGFFTTERKSYNRQYGTTETGRSRFINRFNTWRKSLGTTECKVNADCGAAQAGVACVTSLASVRPDGTPETAVGRCSLPFAVRNLTDVNDSSSADLGPRPIVYHLNDTFPDDLKPMAKELERQFDETFRGIYKSLVGKDAPGQVFFVCPNNPVLAGDPVECGAVGTHARIGDIRFSFLYWVDEPNSARLLGYGPSSNDAETGETVSASAFVYGAAIDTYSATARDLVRLVNGEVAPDKFIDGVNVRAWVNQNKFGRASQALNDDPQAAADAMNFEWTKGLPNKRPIRKGNIASLKAAQAARNQELQGSPLLHGAPGTTARRLKRVRDTAVEEKLHNPHALMLGHQDPRTPLASAKSKGLHPAELFSLERQNFFKQERRRLSAHSVDMAATLDDTVLGFAVAQAGKDPQVVFKKIRELVFLSTALHEVGHTLGLRHNFAGSYDPLNYPKTYWDLRTANGTKAPKPRHIEAETTAELQGITLPGGLRAGIAEFMQSSIMDYGANFNSDIQGLGKYDRAALKFGYGGLVEVFTQVKDPFLMGALQTSVKYGEPQPLFVNCAGSAFASVHYSKMPQIVTLEARADVPRTSLTRAEIGPKCAYPDLVEVDASKRVVVPYKFCSDEFEGASTGCAAYDNGADGYEIATYAINAYKNYYLFDAFKRDRLGFNPDDYYYRITSRYFDGLRSQMQSYVLWRADYDGAIPDDGSPTNFWRSPDGWGAVTVAVTKGFDFFGEVLLTPEPGDYYRYADADEREAYYVDYSDDAPDFSLAIPQARYFNTEWDYDSGYFWYEKVHHVGSFLDKIAAIGELTDPETYFLGKDVAADLRQFSINYFLIYPRQIYDVYGAALTDRWDRLAPLYDPATKKVVTRPISQTIVIPKGAEAPIDPQLGFTVQLYLAEYGVALIPATFNSAFYDSSRVWLSGNGPQIVSTLPTVTYADAKSGKTYNAVSYKAGILETGIGARMIDRANELKALNVPSNPDRAYVAASLSNYVELLESVRAISEVYNNTVY